MWYVYAIPVNGGPGYRVSEPMPRLQAQKECGRLGRESIEPVRYVTRYAH